MYIYIVRHGHETDGFRGGWSQLGLDDIGIKQAEDLAAFFKESYKNIKISSIYSSDLNRALQTATIISNSIGVSVTALKSFREVNNGVLAGMLNETANELYPNLFWRGLEWEQNYPNGESPKEFYNRIKSEWENFLKTVKANDENVILVTHGGVIQIIFSLLKNTKYSNKNNYISIGCCDMIRIEYNTTEESY
ncbi:MAG: histidine phosphatase family protein [Eubacterium sp.]|nr:histidine phosphatase family protein [Eubacterium sp.]